MKYQGGFLSIALAVFVFFTACRNTERPKETVEMAMKQYDHLILKMNVDSIALLYAPDGDLGTMAHGRDSIRKFLNRFAGYKVIAQDSKTDSIYIHLDSAIQKGNYRQKVILPSKDTVTVRGSFTAHWIWLSEGGWHIRLMETHPAT
jgi:hypothetical protein